MNIFITGIAGFLGSHVADRMIELGHNVSGNDNLLGGYIENVNSKALFYNVDCCDISAMNKIICNTDVVIHCAATAHEGLSVFSPEFITRNVFQASISVISASIQNNVKKFVYCSSMARYGDQECPFVETQLPKPTDPYGVAKVAGEDILKILCRIHGMDWVIAVPHNIIGPRQKFDDTFRNVISIMINRILQGQAPIIYGDGNQRRCFSFVDDCVSCIEKMALDSSIKNDIFNIGPDEEFVTINHVVEILCKEMKFNLDPIYVPLRPTEVMNSLCDSSKARNMLGYKTSVSLLDGIKRTIEYIQDCGSRNFKYDLPIEIINDKTPTVWSRKLM